MQINGSPNLHKVVVLNPKGGSGKTTLAFNLAGYLASTGRTVALVDMDRQGSSRHWLSHRSPELPFIYGVSPADANESADADGPVKLPDEIEFAVIDAPASLQRHELIDYTCGAHAILVPVLPSDLDIHAATRLISDLLLVARVSRVNRRLGVVANRVKEHTIAYRQLMRFLQRLTIAVVGVLRDSQNYTWGASKGLCIHEMAPSRVQKDLAQWASVTGWLEERLSTPLTPRDLLRPDTPPRPRQSARRSARAMIPAAAAAIVGAIAAGVWFQTRDPVIADAEQEIVPFAAAPVISRPIERTPAPAIGTPIERTPAPTIGAPTEQTRALPTPAPQQLAPQELVPQELVPQELAPERPAAAPETMSPGEALKEKWQLSGVAQAGSNNVVILRDRTNLTTRRVTSDTDIEGWLVTDAGHDFAVLAHDDEEVRFELNEDDSR